MRFEVTGPDTIELIIEVGDLVALTNGNRQILQEPQPMPESGQITWNIRHQGYATWALVGADGAIEYEACEQEEWMRPGDLLTLRTN